MEAKISLRKPLSDKAKAAKRQRRNNKRKRQREQRQMQSRPSVQNENNGLKENQNGQLKRESLTACDNFAFCEKFKDQMAEAHRIWQDCYDSATNLMYAHQINYWREKASLLERENEELRARLAGQDGQVYQERNVRGCQHYKPQPGLNGMPNGFGTSRGMDMGEDIRDDYLKFVEAARRHREELLAKTYERQGQLGQPNIYKSF